MANIKLGCASWAFTQGRFLPPYESAIDAVAAIGYDSTELIVRNRDDLSDYWSDRRVSCMRIQCERLGLAISQLVVYQDALEGLISQDGARRSDALRVFTQACRIARNLGTTMINFVSPWPEEIQGPLDYLPRYWFTEQRGIEGFDPHLELAIDEEFDWDGLWLRTCEAVRSCAEIADEAGLRLSLEGHTNVMLPNVESFFLLQRSVGSDNIGWNLDTAWHLIQREHVGMCVYKLGSSLFHVDVRDGDGLYCYSLPPGKGVIDWQGFFDALYAVNFEGVVSLELSGYRNPERWARASLDYLREFVR